MNPLQRHSLIEKAEIQGIISDGSRAGSSVV
jgi:hypothetical protein